MRNFKVLWLVMVICIFIFVVPNSLASISVTPSSWEINTHPLSIASQKFTFTSDSNTSSSLAFTKSGTNTNWLNLSSTIGIISNSSTFYLNATVNVPSTADEDTYIIKIRYDSSEIPIILTVTSNITESIGKCRLDITPNSYSLPIVQGSPPATQLFTVYVVKHCEEEVNIKTPLIIGNTQTRSGSKPLSIMGGIDLGYTEPQQEGTFTVQMDVTDLPMGTYQPYMLVDGYYKGEKLTSKIMFNIQVSTGASPIESATALPTYIFSATDLLLNSSYTITAQNINPNYEPFIEPNEFIYGEKVDISNGWVFQFKPIKVGKTKIRVYTYYAGAPIGEITEKEIRITASSLAQLGTHMRFKFFTPNNVGIDNLKGGDEISVLIEDNETGTIIEDATLYLNGKKLDAKTFTVEAGKSYTLDCSRSGFNSIHRDFDVPYQMVSISYSPSDAEIDRNITFTTNPSDANLYLGDSLIEKNYVFGEVGTYTLTAKSDGYQDTNLNLYVSEPLQLLSEIPKKIKIGEEVIIEFNKNLNWNVMFKEKNSTTNQQYISGEGEPYIRFIPEKKGTYEVYARDEKIAIYDVGGSIIKNIFIFLIIVIVAIGVYVGYQRGYFKFERSEKEKPKKTRSPFEIGLPPKSGELID